MSTQIITANRLTEGVVVYFNAEQKWSIWIADAQVFDSAETAEQALTKAQEAVKQNIIVDPYLIDVLPDGQSVKPLKYREIIRAKGPSTHLIEGSTSIPLSVADAAVKSDQAFQNGI